MHFFLLTSYLIKEMFIFLELIQHAPAVIGCFQEMSSGRRNSDDGGKDAGCVKRLPVAQVYEFSDTTVGFRTGDTGA